MFARYIGAGLAFSGIGGVGAGLGILFNGYLRASSSAPRYDATLFGRALLAFALTEAAILFSLLGGLMILFL